LVLDPVVAEVKLTKVLIDGGSRLNLIFVSTLKKMGLDLKDMLVPSKSPFYGIVPGNVAHPLGAVVLPVTFGTRENYRTEFIKFEVANFASSYHAILGEVAKFLEAHCSHRRGRSCAQVPKLSILRQTDSCSSP
jgi:hypothetical protein